MEHGEGQTIVSTTTAVAPTSDVEGSRSLRLRTFGVWEIPASLAPLMPINPLPLFLLAIELSSHRLYDGWPLSCIPRLLYSFSSSVRISTCPLACKVPFLSDSSKSRHSATPTGWPLQWFCSLVQQAQRAALPRPVTLSLPLTEVSAPRRLTSAWRYQLQARAQR
ncbi:hypothetical protein BKA81DRAFT_181725 [Phyllosticta paracitricarpa]